MHHHHYHHHQANNNYGKGYIYSKRICQILYLNVRLVNNIIYVSSAWQHCNQVAFSQFLSSNFTTKFNFISILVQIAFWPSQISLLAIPFRFALMSEHCNCISCCNFFFNSRQHDFKPFSSVSVSVSVRYNVWQYLNFGIFGGRIEAKTLAPISISWQLLCEHHI